MKKWVSSYPYETQVRTSESRSRSAIWHIGKLSDKYFLFTVKDYGRIFNSVCLQAWHKDILGTTPQRFREFKNSCGNLGCSEIFIETPKDLEMQRATWAEYKHHNTVKSLFTKFYFKSMYWKTWPEINIRKWFSWPHSTIHNNNGRFRLQFDWWMY